MVKLQPSKLATWVRFPLPAPSFKSVRQNTMKKLAKLRTAAASFLLAPILSTSLLGSESAETCSLASDTLKVGLKARPAEGLLLFGDAVKLSPDCLDDLIKVAIAEINPDDAVLKQIVHIALNEYPEEATIIAEASMEARPKKAKVIREAFLSRPDPAVEQKKRQEELASIKSSSPIEQFLKDQKKQLAEVEEAENPEAEPKESEEELVDRKIEEAIAKIAAKIEGKPKIVPAPQIAMPEALVQEKTLSGRVGGGTEESEEEPAVASIHGKKISFSRKDKIQVIEPVGPVDESSLDKAAPLDENEEKIDIEDAPVILADEPLRLEPEIVETVEEIPESHQPVYHAPESNIASRMRKSRVYFIPPKGAPGSEATGSELLKQIVIRPMSVSSPKAKN